MSVLTFGAATSSRHLANKNFAPQQKIMKCFGVFCHFQLKSKLMARLMVVSNVCRENTFAQFESPTGVC